ncbi:hypothetical protein F5883DRAFT_169263 [Diaporthe sp. PMI_573]|nr:hypothetical protein F5883DRAFT_169263 [Diaporthaceae sp. PMI_573]
MTTHTKAYLLDDNFIIGQSAPLCSPRWSPTSTCCPLVTTLYLYGCLTTPPPLDYFLNTFHRRAQGQSISGGGPRDLSDPGPPVPQSHTRPLTRQGSVPAARLSPVHVAFRRPKRLAAVWLSALVCCLCLSLPRVGGVTTGGGLQYNGPPLNQDILIPPSRRLEGGGQNGLAGWLAGLQLVFPSSPPPSPSHTAGPDVCLQYVTVTPGALLRTGRRP